MEHRCKLGIGSGDAVLVLNMDASPVNVLPLSTMGWMDAVKALYSDKVEPIAFYDDWIVRSPSIEMKVPSVVMSKSYIKPGRDMKFSRGNIFLRDSHTCQYCLKQFTYNELTMDHVVPKKDGGKTRWTNISSACFQCNSKKGHSRHMKPKTMPYRPTYFEMVEKAKNRIITINHVSWLDYLQWPADNIRIAKHAGTF
jgi:5-methylcytosine-specific restriction endonuclease McrA